MPKFLCRCGTVMDLSIGWQPHEFSLVPKKSLEDIGEGLGQKMDIDKYYDILEEKSKGVLICPSCNRLWIDFGNNTYKPYTQESDSS